MLVELDIQNFAIIKSLKIKFQPQMTVLIGETGAGKSILIDALSLLLGPPGPKRNGPVWPEQGSGDGPFYPAR